MINKQVPIDNLKIVSVAYYKVPVPEQEKVVDLGDGLGLYQTKGWGMKEELGWPTLVRLEEGIWIGQSHNVLIEGGIIKELEWLDEQAKFS